MNDHLTDIGTDPAPYDLDEQRLTKRIRKHSFAGGTLNRNNSLTPSQRARMSKPMHGKKKK